MHSAYLRALADLKLALNRELDAAQLGQPPTKDFARAVGTAMGERQVVINSDPSMCAHDRWGVRPGGDTYCRTCGADTTDMEGMGS